MGDRLPGRQRNAALEIPVRDLELVDEGARARAERQRTLAADGDRTGFRDDLHTVGGNTGHGDDYDDVVLILENVDGRLPGLRLRSAGEPEEPAMHAVGLL